MPSNLQDILTSDTFKTIDWAQKSATYRPLEEQYTVWDSYETLKEQYPDLNVGSVNLKEGFIYGKRGAGAEENFGVYLPKLTHPDRAGLTDEKMQQRIKSEKLPEQYNLGYDTMKDLITLNHGIKSGQLTGQNPYFPEWMGNLHKYQNYFLQRDIARTGEDKPLGTEEEPGKGYFPHPEYMGMLPKHELSTWTKAGRRNIIEMEAEKKYDDLTPGQQDAYQRALNPYPSIFTSDVPYTGVGSLIPPVWTRGIARGALGVQTLGQAGAEWATKKLKGDPNYEASWFQTKKQILDPTAEYFDEEELSSFWKGKGGAAFDITRGLQPGMEVYPYGYAGYAFEQYGIYKTFQAPFLLYGGVQSTVLNNTFKQIKKVGGKFETKYKYKVKSGKDKGKTKTKYVTTPAQYKATLLTELNKIKNSKVSGTISPILAYPVKLGKTIPTRVKIAQLRRSENFAKWYLTEESIIAGAAAGNTLFHNMIGPEAALFGDFAGAIFLPATVALPAKKSIAFSALLLHEMAPKTTTGVMGVTRKYALQPLQDVLVKKGLMKKEYIDVKKYSLETRASMLQKGIGFRKDNKGFYKYEMNMSEKEIGVLGKMALALKGMDMDQYDEMVNSAIYTFHRLERLGIPVEDMGILSAQLFPSPTLAAYEAHARNSIKINRWSGESTNMYPAHQKVIDLHVESDTLLFDKFTDMIHQTDNVETKNLLIKLKGTFSKKTYKNNLKDQVKISTTQKRLNKTLYEIDPEQEFLKREGKTLDQEARPLISSKDIGKAKAVLENQRLNNKFLSVGIKEDLANHPAAIVDMQDGRRIFNQSKRAEQSAKLLDDVIDNRKSIVSGIYGGIEGYESHRLLVNLFDTNNNKILFNLDNLYTEALGTHMGTAPFIRKMPSGEISFKQFMLNQRTKAFKNFTSRGTTEKKTSFVQSLLEDGLIAPDTAEETITAITANKAVDWDSLWKIAKQPREDRSLKFYQQYFGNNYEISLKNFNELSSELGRQYRKTLSDPSLHKDGWVTQQIKHNLDNHIIDDATEYAFAGDEVLGSKISQSIQEQSKRAKGAYRDLIADAIYKNTGYKIMKKGPVITEATKPENFHKRFLYSQDLSSSATSRRQDYDRLFLTNFTLNRDGENIVTKYGLEKHTETFRKHRVRADRTMQAGILEDLSLGKNDLKAIDFDTIKQKDGKQVLNFAQGVTHKDSFGDIIYEAIKPSHSALDDVTDRARRSLLTHDAITTIFNKAEDLSVKIATGINSRNYVNKKGHDTLQDLFAKAGEPGNKTKFVETLLQSSQKGGNAEVMDTLLRAIQVKKGTEGAVPIEIGFKQIYQKTGKHIEEFKGGEKLKVEEWTATGKASLEKGDPGWSGQGKQTIYIRENDASALKGLLWQDHMQYVQTGFKTKLKNRPDLKDLASKLDTSQSVDFAAGIDYLLNNDEILSRLYKPEELQRLKDIFSLGFSLSATPKSLSMVGLPVDYTVQAILGRGYNISKGVVSPRFVLSELAINEFRARQHQLLMELVTNPKATKVLYDMVISDQVEKLTFSNKVFRPWFLGWLGRVAGPDAVEDFKIKEASQGHSNNQYGYLSMDSLVEPEKREEVRNMFGDGVPYDIVYTGLSTSPDIHTTYKEEMKKFYIPTKKEVERQETKEPFEDVGPPGLKRKLKKKFEDTDNQIKSLLLEARS